MADAFLQDATHAPHPIHAAASIALSESSFGTGNALPSGALPVRTVIKPPAWGYYQRQSDQPLNL